MGETFSGEIQYDQVMPLLERYAEDFGNELDEEEKADIDIVLKVTELVDGLYDGLSNAQEREKLSGAIIEMLQTGRANEVILSHICLNTHVITLIEVLDRRKTRSKFIEDIKEIFITSNIIKTTTDVRVLIEQSLVEGHLTGKLIGHVIKDDTDISLKEFIANLISVGNLLDDMNDAQEDYDNKEKAYKPDFLLYYKGAIALLRGFYKMYKTYPKGKSFLLTTFNKPSYVAALRNFM